MKILIVGNGGREAAIAHTLLKFNPEAQIFVAPGNGGTATMCQNIDLSVSDLEGLLAFAKSENIELTVVGPEVPLVEGIVDLFEKEGLKVFGPNKQCATFEGSKKFTKEFLMRHHIPTARYESFSKSQKQEALEAVANFSLPVVVKADGLAAGKGVLICETHEDAKLGIEQIFADKFQGAGEDIVLEEFLVGTEASLLCFVDGKVMVPMETARDYKRALDGDEGLNTGGMGGFSPNPIMTEEVMSKVKAQILDPIMDGFKAETLDFKGILFIGLMIDQGEPKVLEFNVRFGDPETQSVLPRLRTNLLDVLMACVDGTLDEMTLEWDENPSVTVVIASGNYPESGSRGLEITGLGDVDAGTFVYHAGTVLEGNQIMTNGGRVLAVTQVGESLEVARNKVYEEIQKIHFENMRYRKDIASL
ncbi:MAG: phosphoribosylamine--glycine ligase [Cellulosilyticaceae bacterium]